MKSACLYWPSMYVIHFAFCSLRLLFAFPFLSSPCLLQDKAGSCGQSQMLHPHPTCKWVSFCFYQVIEWITPFSLASAFGYNNQSQLEGCPLSDEIRDWIRFNGFQVWTHRLPTEKDHLPLTARPMQITHPVAVIHRAVVEGVIQVCPVEEQETRLTIIAPPNQVCSLSLKYLWPLISMI